MRHVKTLVATAAVATVAVAGSAQALPIGVPAANPAVGSPPNRIVPSHQLVLRAQGSDPLENPSGAITNYGHLSDGTPTEPDQNLYLTFPHGLGGPTAGYDYGTHFLFQGHEAEGDLAYVTRINLDVTDPAHRISLMTPTGADDLTHFNELDGSAWDPSTGTNLYTQEDGNEGGVVEGALDGSSVRTLYGEIGRGGYEGIHPNAEGDILIEEDVGGTSVNTDPGNPASPKVAKQPNSFIYRFVPSDRTDLGKGGVLQALQVRIGSRPVVFHANDPVGDTFSAAQLALNTRGVNWPVRWVTVHDTAVDGTASFDANALAKSAGATPFKRPENGTWQPGSDFRTFFFVATGDTNSVSGNVPALAARGAWGTVFRVHLNPSGNQGAISVAASGDSVHNSFDNVTFASPNRLLITEDRGDALHDQLNTLDSVWEYRIGDPNPERFIALGRDPEATPPSAEDNEPTGMFVSNGSTDLGSMYGTEANLVDARAFMTEQHGRNQTFEVVRNFRKIHR